MKQPRLPNTPWTVEELAAAARVTPNHIYDLIKANKIPALRVGKLIRIADAECRRLLQLEGETTL